MLRERISRCHASFQFLASAQLGAQSRGDQVAFDACYAPDSGAKADIPGLPRRAKPEVS
jgi:hypothetical protein